MSDEYRYRVSMTCDTHGGIYGYLYCPECTISALRGEVERLQAALNEEIVISQARKSCQNNLEDLVDQKDAIISRYREAVEWACGVLERSHDNPYMQPDIVAAELKRRAGEG